MGERGKAPKRSEERRRRNEPEVPVTKAAGAAIVDQPEVPPHWHPLAKRWYESLAESGQSRFYEPSDWSTALLVGESLSRDMKPQFVGINPETGRPITRTLPLRGASLASYLKAFTGLLATEVDRRRMHIELERPTPEQEAEQAPGVADMDYYRQHFSG